MGGVFSVTNDMIGNVIALCENDPGYVDFSLSFFFFFTGEGFCGCSKKCRINQRCNSASSPAVWRGECFSSRGTGYPSPCHEDFKGHPVDQVGGVIAVTLPYIGRPGSGLIDGKAEDQSCLYCTD